MNKKQNTTSMWFAIIIVFVIGLSFLAWYQHKQIRAMEARIDNFLSYDLPVDNIVDLEKRVESNTHNQENVIEVVWDILARLEPHNLAEDPETNWTIVYKELADLEGRTYRLDGYIWDITYELTGSPLNAENHYAYGNEMSGLSRIDQLYEEIWGARNNEALDADNPTFLECGYTAMKPGCPDSRIDQVHYELYEEYFDEDLDSTQSDYSRIDALWRDNIRGLYEMYFNLHEAFCQIEPVHPLCVQ